MNQTNELLMNIDNTDVDTKGDTSVTVEMAAYQVIPYTNITSSEDIHLDDSTIKPQVVFIQQFVPDGDVDTGQTDGNSELQDAVANISEQVGQLNPDNHNTMLVVNDGRSIQTATDNSNVSETFQVYPCLPMEVMKPAEVSKKTNTVSTVTKCMPSSKHLLQKFSAEELKAMGKTEDDILYGYSERSRKRRMIELAKQSSSKKQDVSVVDNKNVNINSAENVNDNDKTVKTRGENMILADTASMGPESLHVIMNSRANRGRFTNRKSNLNEDSTCEKREIFKKMKVDELRKSSPGRAKRAVARSCPQNKNVSETQCDETDPDLITIKVEDEDETESYIEMNYWSNICQCFHYPDKCVIKIAPILQTMVKKRECLIEMVIDDNLNVGKFLKKETVEGLTTYTVSVNNSQFSEKREILPKSYQHGKLRKSKLFNKRRRKSIRGNFKIPEKMLTECITENTNTCTITNNETKSKKRDKMLPECHINDTSDSSDERKSNSDDDNYECLVNDSEDEDAVDNILEPDEDISHIVSYSTTQFEGVPSAPIIYTTESIVTGTATPFTKHNESAANLTDEIENVHSSQNFTNQNENEQSAYVYYDIDKQNENGQGEYDIDKHNENGQSAYDIDKHNENGQSAYDFDKHNENEQSAHDIDKHNENGQSAYDFDKQNENGQSAYDFDKHNENEQSAHDIDKHNENGQSAYDFDKQNENEQSAHDIDKHNENGQSAYQSLSDCTKQSSTKFIKQCESVKVYTKQTESTKSSKEDTKGSESIQNVKEYSKESDSIESAPKCSTDQSDVKDFLKQPVVLMNKLPENVDTSPVKQQSAKRQRIKKLFYPDTRQASVRQNSVKPPRKKTPQVTTKGSQKRAKKYVKKGRKPKESPKRVDGTASSGRSARPSRTKKPENPSAEKKYIVKVNEEGVRLFECPVCGYSSRFSQNTSKHIGDHTADKNFICDQCGAAFKSRHALMSHVVVHQTDRPYTCPLCPQAFKRVKSFRCIECGYICKERTRMKVHLYQHTDERPFQCEVCGRTFKVPSGLDSHRRLHFDKMFYTCEFCQKQFKDLSCFKQHYRRHIGDRRHDCQQCGKSFITSTELKTHKRTHTGEKPYECDICNKTFVVRGSMLRHKNQHTNKHRFECSICQQSYTRRDLCMGHVKRSHPNEADSVTITKLEMNTGGVNKTTT